MVGEKQELPDAFPESVRPAVVRLGAGARDDFWGSGFFVAQGWVITAAHVLAAGGGRVWEGEQFAVRTADGRRFAGELAVGLPGPPATHERRRRWPFPDLALVRVRHHTGSECLWLSDRSHFRPVSSGLYGWMLTGGEAEFHTVVGRASGGGEGREHLVLTDARVRDGCSGGPVIDLDRGEVIGVCKANDAGETLVTPVTALRTLRDHASNGGRVLHEVLQAHDRHHFRRLRAPGECWPRRQAQLPEAPSKFAPDKRAELYAILARLAPPRTAGEVLRLSNEARWEVRRDSYHVRQFRPYTWREGAGLLYDAHDGGAVLHGVELDAVVVYAMKVCAALGRERRGSRAVLQELYGWVEKMLPQMRSEVLRERVITGFPGTDPAGTSGRPALRVVVQPDFTERAHDWQVEVVQPNGSKRLHTAAARPVSPGRLAESISAALAPALDTVDAFDHRAGIEFVLPRQLFDLPVDRWLVRLPGAEGEGEEMLGRARTVVLRDWQRELPATHLGYLDAEHPADEDDALVSGEHTAHALFDERAAGTDGETAEREARERWERRWRGVRQGPMEPRPLLPGAPRPHPGTRRGLGAPAGTRPSLAQSPVTSVPIHLGDVSHGMAANALDEAVDAGYAVALWLRDADPAGREGAESQGADVATRARVDDPRAATGPIHTLLGEAVQAPGLPARLQELRADAPGRDDTVQAACARRLALLYDPPQQRLRSGPLLEPPWAGEDFPP